MDPLSKIDRIILLKCEDDNWSDEEYIQNQDTW